MSHEPPHDFVKLWHDGVVRAALSPVIAVLAVALSLTAAPAALAGTATMSSNSVEYSARAGERNAVSVSMSDAGGQRVTIRDSAGVIPGPGCVRPASKEGTVAVCSPDLSGASLAHLEAALGDGDDSLRVSGPLGIDGNGGSGSDKLTGGRFDDRLDGGGGRDTIRGGAGDDELAAGAGGAVVSGGAGEDRLQGGSGPDVLDGGRGTDLLSGVNGNDLLRARDGTPDEVYCGRGHDRASVDGVDFISSACEKLPRGRFGAATLIDPNYRFFSPSFAEGGTNLMIGCPGDGPRRCSGTIIVRRGRTVLGRGPFSIRRDRVGQARAVKPTKAGAALPTGKRVKATVTLVTSDRAGRSVVRSRAGSAEDFPASEFE